MIEYKTQEKENQEIASDLQKKRRIWKNSKKDTYYIYNSETWKFLYWNIAKEILQNIILEYIINNEDDDIFDWNLKIKILQKKKEAFSEEYKKRFEKKDYERFYYNEEFKSFISLLKVMSTLTTFIVMSILWLIIRGFTLIMGKIW